MTTPVAPSRTAARPINGRRLEALLLGGLVALSGAAWVLTSRLADSESRLGLLTGAGGGAGGHAHHGGGGGGSRGAGYEVADAGLFLAMWVVMVAAMMLPTALPVVATFNRWKVRTGRPGPLTLVFVSGYLSIWSACGVVAYAALALLGAVVPRGGDGVVRLGAVLLVGAGAYQFSPLKQACLTHCRSPISVIAEHAVELHHGYRGPWRVGTRHGLYCIGCCWSLMLVLLLVGMMSLVWMGLLAAVMLAEKAAPWGAALARGTGVALVVVGAFLLVWPATLPALW